MADAVTSNVIYNVPPSYIIHLTNVSDGTGEAAVIKIDKSALLAQPARSGSTPIAPVAMDIETVRWAIQGFTYVKLAWNHTAVQTALLLSGSGYDDFTVRPGATSNVVRTTGLVDGRGAGGTGNIELTTVGAISGATYDITLAVILRYS